MNLINALGGPALWIPLLLVPFAIISLYFLKLKRQPLEVPSTYLWSRTIEDLHVNSIWQKLRQSLLLFLQLLVILLAALACLRPGWRGARLLDERFIFLIYNSASMAATDMGQSRLDEAKRQVTEMIDELGSNQVAMVISFSDETRIEQLFSNSRSQLRMKVNRIRQTNRRSDLSEAVRAAAGLANPPRTSEDGTNDVQTADALPATLYIFSDGGFDKVPDFSLGNLTPNYVRVGSELPNNVGITSFTSARNPEKPGQTQAFARLENSGPQDVSVGVTLLLDGDLIDAAAVEVPADGSGAVQFDLDELDEGVLELQIEEKDDLAADNRAFSVLNTPRRAEVLVLTPGNQALQVALTTDEALTASNARFESPEYLESDEYRNLTLAGTFDLVIYDQCVPTEMPQANTFFVGRVPPLESWKASEVTKTPVIIDVEPEHPLTQFVQMGDVKWNYDGFSVTGPEGATVLFDADIGPFLVIGHREGFEDAVLGMEIVGAYESGEIGPKSEWPIRRSFPVFVMNLLRYLGGARNAAGADGVRVGDPVSLKSILPVGELRVIAPNGSREEISREGQNSFLYSQTNQLGVYRVEEGRAREVTQHFAVNLFDGRESDLRTREQITLGYEEIEGRAGLEPARQELWKWVILLAILVLMFEWYIYNRRVYI